MQNKIQLKKKKSFGGGAYINEKDKNNNVVGLLCYIGL